MARRRRRSRSGRPRGCKTAVRRAVRRCKKSSGKSCSSAIRVASKNCIPYAAKQRKSAGRRRRRARKNIRTAFGGWF